MHNAKNTYQTLQKKKILYSNKVYLEKQGYTVLGIRLKGHGTSPYALRDLSYEQWFVSVQRGLNILKVHCPKLFVIGFSTGGALALKLVAESHTEIIGLVAVSVPIKFVNQLGFARKLWLIMLICLSPSFVTSSPFLMMTFPFFIV